MWYALTFLRGPVLWGICLLSRFPLLVGGAQALCVARLSFWRLILWALAASEGWPCMFHAGVFPLADLCLAHHDVACVYEPACVAFVAFADLEEPAKGLGASFVG